MTYIDKYNKTWSTRSTRTTEAQLSNTTENSIPLPPPKKKTRLCAKKYLSYQIQGSKIVKKSKSIHKQRRYGRKATRLLVSESVSYIKLKTSLASKNCYQNTKAIQNIAVILYFLILVIESLSRLTNLRIININRGIPYTANGTQITHPTIFIFVLFLFLV